MRGNKILERLTVKDSNTPHPCDYRYIDPLNITGNNRLNNQKNGLYVGTYNSTTKILFRS